MNQLLLGKNLGIKLLPRHNQSLQFLFRSSFENTEGSFGAGKGLKDLQPDLKIQATSPRNECRAAGDLCTTIMPLKRFYEFNGANS